MTCDEIKQLIEKNLVNTRAEVDGDGYHFEVNVYGNCFADKNAVQQQQLVYAALGDNIQNGNIHAVSIKTFVD